MKHSEAEPLLLDFVTDALDANDRLPVENHVQGCEECAGWISTYRLLENSFGKDENHPTPDELARYALLYTVEVETEQHITACDECRHLAEVTNGAVSHLRGFPPRVQKTRIWSTVLEHKFAVAACFLIAILGIPFLLTMGSTPADHTVSGEAFGGHSRLVADRSLTVTDTSIDAGADVTMHAGSMVALGNGFSIDSGASLVVEVDEVRQ